MATLIMSFLGLYLAACFLIFCNNLRGKKSDGPPDNEESIGEEYGIGEEIAGLEGVVFQGFLNKTCIAIDWNGTTLHYFLTSSTPLQFHWQKVCIEKANFQKKTITVVPAVAGENFST